MRQFALIIKTVKTSCARKKNFFQKPCNEMPKGQYKYVKVIRPKNIGRFMREPQDRDVYIILCGPQQGGEKMDKNRIKGLKRRLSVLAL